MRQRLFSKPTRQQAVSEMTDKATAIPPFPWKASEQPTLSIWLATCGLGYQLMVSQLSFKLPHNFNRNEAGPIVLNLIFEGKLWTIPISFLNKGELKGTFHLVKIFGNFGSVEIGKCFVCSSHWKITGKSGKSKKVGPFSRLELLDRNFMFHLHVSCTLYQFQLLPTRQPS